MKINKQSSLYFVCFFSAVIFGFVLFLYAVHSFMAEKIEHAKQEEVTKILNQNMPCKNYIKTSINNTELYYCKNERIIALQSKSDFAYADKIEYVVFLNIVKNNVDKIAILNHKETPGLGDKIEDASWQETLYHKAKSLLHLKADGGTIDTFTAASITPRTLLQSLREDIDFLIENKKQVRQLIQG